MITLTVISFNDAPPAAGPLSARFDELGGTIGRADSNQLILPDPERTISRVAAQVVFRNGAYAIVDRGSNPIAVNGRSLGSGRETLLKAGDKLRIGNYVIQIAAAAAGAAAGGAAASAAGASRSDDPFAGLLGPAAAPVAAGGGRVIDPLAALAAAKPAGAPDLITQSPGAGRAPAQAPAADAGIPDNWDPFAPPTNWGAMTGSGAKKPAPAVRRAGIGLDTGNAAPPPLLPGLFGSGGGSDGGGLAKTDSLDALFGLGAVGSGADPLAASKLDAPIAQPNMAGHADPMRALNIAPQASAATAPDGLSDLQRPFIPPTTIAAPELQSKAAAAPPAGAVLSWGVSSEQSMTVVNAPSLRRPMKPAAEALVKPAARSADNEGSYAEVPKTIPTAIRGPRRAALVPPVPQAATPPATPPAKPPAIPTATPAAEALPVANVAQLAAAATARSTTGAGTANEQALLAALLQGLEIQDSPMTALTPEFMRLVGTLLREAIGGTVDLLVARAAMKRELRAVATTIVARDNNPLKFSPSGEAAMQHLLAPPVRGFMPATEAMRDAYGDLRAHQFAFVAGMQAALEGVLERFDPQALEGQLSRASVLSSLLPGSRKAKMWDVFVDHYAHIREQASDDFHSLFGKAFLKAYEEQLEQLRAPHVTQPGVKR